MSNTYSMARGWMEHPAFAKEPMTEREAWEWMIASAAWKDTVANINGNPAPIKRGQLSYSIRFLAEAWGWDRGKADRFLKKLKKWDMIVTESVTGQNVITICNYNTYQFVPNANVTGARREPRQERDRSVTNKNQDNQDNQDNHINPPIVPLDDAGEDQKTVGEKSKRATSVEEKPPDKFAEFWNIYPKQRAGSAKKARMAWNSALIEERATEEEIIDGARRYANSHEVARGFAKGAAAWLNDDRWTSDYSRRPVDAQAASGNTGYMAELEETAHRLMAEDAHPPDQH